MLITYATKILNRVLITKIVCFKILFLDMCEMNEIKLNAES